MRYSLKNINYVLSVYFKLQPILPNATNIIIARIYATMFSIKVKNVTGNLLDRGPTRQNLVPSPQGILQDMFFLKVIRYRYQRKLPALCNRQIFWPKGRKKYAVKLNYLKNTNFKGFLGSTNQVKNLFW